MNLLPDTETDSLAGRYRLGLPAWAFPGWRDEYFDDRPSRLSSYSAVFNAVEGNTTFYRSPDRSTLQRWAAEVDGRDFRFSFKLPRSVTHERRWNGRELDAFLDAIDGLGACLGPLLLQFPAQADPAWLQRFEPAFAAIAARTTAVLEVRHPIFFQEPERLEPVLERHALGRVMLDTRPLYRGDTRHPEVLAARHEKPELPLLHTCYNGIAFVRLVLHPMRMSNARWLEDWADRTARMLEAEQSVWMLIHCPNNAHCPPLAREFHERLRTRRPAAALPPLPPWPVPRQGSLL